MKSKNLIIVGLLILAGGIFSCNEKLEVPDACEEFPVEIKLIEYSLEGTSCQWIRFQNSLVRIVNSNEELGNYIECRRNLWGDCVLPCADYPEIDFSKYTLLIANGFGTSNIGALEFSAQYIECHEIVLSITVRMGVATVAQPWVLAVLAPKISAISVVTLKVEYIR